MHECSVCGVLSIGVDVCPACGSRIHNDIQVEGAPNSMGELPGLSEAMDSWKEVVLDHDIPSEVETAQSSTGSLPFSFQGHSNQFDEALPFGIGSNSEGIPFEYDKDDSFPTEVNSTKEDPEIATAIPELPEVDTTDDMVSTSSVVIGEQEQENSQYQVDKLQPVIPGMEKIESDSINSLPESLNLHNEGIQAPENTDSIPLEEESKIISVDASLTDKHVVNQPLEVQNAPALWSINAKPIDLAQMNAELETVVNYEHNEEEDVIEYIHTQESGEEEVPMDEMNESFVLFPTRAQAVNLVDSSQEVVLKDAYNSMANGNWSDSAKLFQKIIAKQPQDPNVMNNYGLSLMERALEIEAINDSTSADKAFTQYKTAIMVLKEAAKLDPTNLDCLYNLAHALLISGREEKCLAIVERIQATEGKTPQTSMLKSACLFNQGLFDMARVEIEQFSNMEIIQHNLKVIPGL